MKLLLAILTLALLFTSGCSTKKRMVVADVKELPSWYTHSNNNSATALYATGEGKNRDEAIKDALNIMLSTLGVSIASTYSSTLVDERGLHSSYRQTTKSELQSSVKEIRVSNYKLLKSQNFSFNRYIVLIESNKKELFASLKNELDKKFALIQRNIEKNFTNIVQRFRSVRDAKQQISGVQNILLVMHSLQKDFNDNIYVEKIVQIDSDYEKLQSSMTFSIETNADAKELKEVIYSGLSAKKLQILNEKKNLDTHLNVSIHSKIQQVSAYGIILARSAIFIVVTDYKGRVVGSNKLNISGQSTQGFALAKENISEKLHQMVLKDGIEKVIGLSL